MFGKTAITLQPTPCMPLTFDFPYFAKEVWSLYVRHLLPCYSPGRGFLWWRGGEAGAWEALKYDSMTNRGSEKLQRQEIRRIIEDTHVLWRERRGHRDVSILVSLGVEAKLACYLKIFPTSKRLHPFLSIQQQSWYVWQPSNRVILRCI